MGVPYAEVIGDPIAHSKSPLIHRFWLEKLEIAADYRAMRVGSHELPSYLANRRSDADWRGCNVTAPYKQAIIPLLDRLSPEAETLGAANVVLRNEAGLVGHNSDSRGFLEPLLPWPGGPKNSQYQSRSAILFGTGGAARAVAHALAAHDFLIIIVGRRQEAAECLRRDLRCGHVVEWSHFAEPTDYVRADLRDEIILLVNATPVGMNGFDRLPLRWSRFPAATIVYDLVYAPLATPLLKSARRQGHQVINGLGMLVGQAAISFKLLFGKPAPRQHDAELRELLTR